MHEFSIADALATQVRRHVPADARVTEVDIRVGALRGLEPESLDMCWQAVTNGTALQGSALRVDSIPWTISCGSCGATWTSPVPFVTCDSCGDPAPRPSGSDELSLVSITVEDGAEVA